MLGIGGGGPRGSGRFQAGGGIGVGCLGAPEPAGEQVGWEVRGAEGR